MPIARATPEDATRLASLAQSCWPEVGRWGHASLRDILTSDTGLILTDRDLTSGLIILRVVLSEAEILDLGVAPAARRAGLGRALLAAAETEASKTGNTPGATRLFLEVAETNLAARRLYEEAGFGKVGIRRGYYLTANGQREDALVLRKDLT